MNFESNPRRRQEIMGRPIADAIYKGIFGSDLQIDRFESEDEAILDIKFALDVKLTLTTGQILLGQEKFLSERYSKFRSITVEYMQNSAEQGDWFKLGAQFYFVGYYNRDGNAFEPWIMFNWPNVVMETHYGNIEWEDNKNKDGRAQASFKWCAMGKFPEWCIVASSLTDWEKFLLEEA